MKENERKDIKRDMYKKRESEWERERQRERESERERERERGDNNVNIHEKGEILRKETRQGSKTNDRQINENIKMTDVEIGW